MVDTWTSVEDDVREVFGYREDERPQSRAHAYIERRKVLRGFNDTALQVACMDMCRRSYELGKAESLSGMPGVEMVAADVAEASGKLLRISLELRGMSERKDGECGE